MKIRIAMAALSVVALAACAGTTPAPSAGGSGPATTPGTQARTESKKLTVVTHDSFALPEELLKKFADQTGYEVTYTAPGEGTSLVNQLILTKDSPLGDVVFGIDSTTAPRVVREGVIVPHVADAKVKDGLAAEGLTPVDFGDVCVNADSAWFATNNVPVPTTLDDLVAPAYKDLVVVPSPTSSSPGQSFLLATIGAKGDGWLDYWKALKDNGVKFAAGWSDAYYTDFSGADGKGPRPLVLSYATSPAYTVDGDASTTEALLGTCIRQVEYAGILAGAQNEVGAAKFIDFLLTPEVQATIPENMYMYPALDGVALPEAWAKFAPLSDQPIAVDGAEVDANLENWLRTWAEEIG
ncbi:MAG: thiamine ABC transporter substrate-binding protein [Tessaracoccus sp.]|uniref:thiamine ABC transporter substrate-binding protein n=1 Tax=Tessaracoccus sp. TaxID=1971211 RepID=UPI001EB1B18D|nr:thiamine ABC transporter substrate-binding protein [Tessaracoccus sp.]MBK7822606.1 thiamine ABC transporter substrate-binding protein [Tessaracoccus sp.]